jgi:hypothetical protein
MHTGALAARNERAQKRMMAAAGSLAVLAGLDQRLVDALIVSDKDRDVRAMKQREAVADLLEALTNAPVFQPREEVIQSLEDDTVSTETVVPPGEEVSDEETPEIASFAAMTVEDIRMFIVGVTNADHVKAMIGYERAGKNRKTAVEILEARLNELEGSNGPANA